VQMMADSQRGWAWVDALVSAYTPELIMTGPMLIQPSLKTLCDLCEDHLGVKRTKRLSPVEVARRATTLKQLDEGSMLVAFSRKTVLEAGDDRQERLGGLRRAIAGSAPRAGPTLSRGRSRSHGRDGRRGHGP